MRSRIPLAIAMKGVSPRESVPHHTYEAPLCSSFFSYLESNDTRLPSHPYLNPCAQPPEDYETYVGEDVWAKHASEDESEGDHLPELRFDAVVEWVADVLEREWAEDGVVLCGKYVVADDCTWAVPSRTCTLFTPREVFLVMRNSSRFLGDIHEQIQSGAPTIHFSLAKAMSREGAREMRVFVPYTIPCAGAGGDWISVTPMSHPVYAGICQRFTDVCFPSLMAWTEEDHHEHFQLILRRVLEGKLLERALGNDSSFLLHLNNRYQRWWRREGKRVYHQQHTQHATLPDQVPAYHLIVLLAVDILFDSAQLPIYVLSAKAHMFLDRSWLDVKEDVMRLRPHTPYLWEPLDYNETDDSKSSPAITTEHHDDDTEEDDYGSSSDRQLNFFRLFRNTDGWNHYVDVVASRIREAEFASASHSETLRDSNIISKFGHDNDTGSSHDASIRHYCVVASESADLIMCSDTISKRGLPLELTHPELLLGNTKGLEILQHMRQLLARE